MKKKVIFFLFCFFSLLNLFISIKSDDFSSKSFFSVQRIFGPTTPECVSIKHDQIRLYEEEKRYSFDATVFGGSTFNEDDLAKYFLPFQKKEIIAGELGSKAVKEGDVDVIANYFGVLTSNFYTVGSPVNGTFNNYTFQSKVKFAPKQTFAGVTLTYKQHLSRYLDKGFWFEIVVPIETVTNTIGMTEEITTAGGPDGNNPTIPPGFVPNMTSAFRQSTWRFGKINGPQSATGVADLYFKVGYLTLKEENYFLRSYAGLSFPTGNQVTGEFLFEPIVGQNKHATLFGATSIGFKVWSRCNKSIYMELDTCGTLFFSNDQIRSFDIKDKSWSRYMWVYLDSTTTTTSPGINVFTKNLNVQPGTARDLNTALIYRDGNFQAEGGYHFYSRQAEEVKFSKPWEPGPGIAAIYNSANDFIAGGLTRDNATIKQYTGIDNDTINDTFVFRELQESDFDMESASHPALISHTIYVALSGHWDQCGRHPKFFGVGGSYEFSSNNAATQRWMAWARFGLSF